MKVSISSWNYNAPITEGKTDLLAFADEVKRLGADGLEIFGRHLNGDDLAGHLKRVVAKAGDLGLEISSLIEGNDFARPAAAERGEQVERMKQWIAMAAEAGIERLNTFTGYHTPGEDPAMEVCRVIDAYREVAPLAERHGVLLCIENHSSVCRDADGILAIIRRVGSDCIRTNPDVTNFVPDFGLRGPRAREAIYTETAKLAPVMANAHLKVGEFTETGEHAHVDMPRLMGLFRDAGYDGHVVLEVYGDGDRPEACAKGVTLMRKYL